MKQKGEKEREGKLASFGGSRGVILGKKKNGARTKNVNHERLS